VKRTAIILSIYLLSVLAPLLGCASAPSQSQSEPKSSSPSSSTRAPSRFGISVSPHYYTKAYTEDKLPILDKEWFAQKLDRVRDLGSDSVFLEVFWDVFEPSKGQFNFDFYDDAIDVCRNKDMVVIAGIWTAPEWARTPGLLHSPPTRVEDFAEAVRAFTRHNVEKHGSYIRYYQLWNEPNYNLYWQPNPDVKTYVTMVNLAYDRIHQEQPEAVVIQGAICDDDVATVPGADFLKAMYQLGIKKDMISMHCYQSGPSFVQSLREVMKAEGDEQTPIAVTELGWDDRWGGKGRMSEILQDYISQVKALSYVDNVIIYQLQDNPSNRMGLIDLYGTEKPAYGVVKELLQS